MHVIVICGPTATGKTALAVEIAHKINSEIISADSRQVYKGLDIGSGKDLQEYRKYAQAITYHLIDIIEPHEVYSLFRYQQDFYQILNTQKSSSIILCGGSGLYIEAVLKQYRIANIPENFSLRNELSQLPQTELLHKLQEEASSLLWDSTDKSSKKRIVRALEIMEAEKLAPISYGELPKEPFTFTVFAIKMERPLLQARIAERLHQRLQSGMIEEVKLLMENGLSRHRLDLLGMEYREIAAYLCGEKSYNKMAMDLENEIRHLAKRQETYFRGMEKRGIPIHWIEAGDQKSILDHVQNSGENT